MRKQRPQYPPVGPRDRLKFGKYRGRPLWEVIRDDPSYVVWLLRNLEGFRLSADARAHLEAVRRFGI